MVLNIHDPIAPGVGLGGLRVAQSVLTIHELLLKASLTGELTWRLEGLFEAVYRFTDSPIEIGVDVRNGKIFRLSARAGYLGAAIGAVRVGTPLAQAQKTISSIVYDEAEDLYLIAGVPGISFEVTESRTPTPPPEISVISVYAPQLETSAG